MEGTTADRGRKRLSNMKAQDSRRDVTACSTASAVFIVNCSNSNQKACVIHWEQKSWVTWCYLTHFFPKVQSHFYSVSGETWLPVLRHKNDCPHSDTVLVVDLDACRTKATTVTARFAVIGLEWRRRLQPTATIENHTNAHTHARARAHTHD